MYEFQMWNVITKKQTILFGYSLDDAFRRHPSLNPEDWECLGYEYID